MELFKHFAMDVQKVQICWSSSESLFSPGCSKISSQTLLQLFLSYIFQLGWLVSLSISTIIISRICRQTRLQFFCSFNRFLSRIPVTAVDAGALFETVEYQSKSYRYAIHSRYGVQKYKTLFLYSAALGHTPTGAYKCICPYNKLASLEATLVSKL